MIIETVRAADTAATMGLDYSVSGDEISTLDRTELNLAAWDAIRLSPVLMAEARGWVEDSFSGAAAHAMHTLTVLGQIVRHYSGGILGFYMDTRGLIPVTTYKGNK